MFLYFKGEYLGEILNVNKEGAWMYGELKANENLEKFRRFFIDLTDEDKEFDETKFNEEWLTDSNWFIIDVHNNKRGIYLPAISLNGDIDFRYR
ncbi:hypothetical protein QUF79_21990 [Fictibacillus enclensis]|uniref:hypothetical protein n=1 Tax=Fictibacillus enclensis TaxID=1017270 RepID=UPI0025A0810C|nr:hypothetical protein [Fictibacillus enclensis]MDM5200695.1 hypothetical protein [Fictibacillus enclensis]